MSKFLNISTDNTLGGNSASDDIVASQKAVKDYIDNKPGLTVDQTYNAISTNAQSGTAVAEALAGFSGANTDLSNLTSTGQNIANWSSNVTNCITEIPQDIKLELNNGTLTLKSGSKVYIPSGFEQDGTTPKFHIYTLDADKTATVGSSGTYLVSFLNNGVYANKANYASGSSLPSSFTGLFYNVSTNIIDNYTAGSASGSRYSLPVAVIKTSSGSVTSIDQVFNGFGYIGSTVFALPGVKGLIPNGRNEDGSLKNIEIATNSVVTRTFSDTTTAPNVIEISSYINISVISSLLRLYDETENHIMNTSDNSIRLTFPIASCTRTSGVISDWNPKTAFHALDYNDSSTISGWAMPSSKYINLTLGATGTSYKAPANGYACIQKKATAVSQYLTIYRNGENSLGSYADASASATQALRCYIPVKKGKAFTVTYTVAGSTQQFIFIYAEGEN